MVNWVFLINWAVTYIEHFLYTTFGIALSGSNCTINSVGGNRDVSVPNLFSCVEVSKFIITKHSMPLNQPPVSSFACQYRRWGVIYITKKRKMAHRHWRVKQIIHLDNDKWDNKDIFLWNMSTKRVHAQQCIHGVSLTKIEETQTKPRLE